MPENNKFIVPKLPPKYTLCVAGYHKRGDYKRRLIRMTAIVVRLDTDQVVEHLEANKSDSMDAFSDQVIELSKKYNVDITMLERSVKLERCGCGTCDGYLDRMITSSNLKQAELRKHNCVAKKRN